MRLLLDTHAFLFAIGETEQLSPRAAGLLSDPAVERWVSSGSIWEIAIKVQIGKLAMPVNREFYIGHLAALKAKMLSVDLSHSLAMLSLPMHHRDPFDRLLIAQAREERMTLLTRDQQFAAYDVPTVW